MSSALFKAVCHSAGTVVNASACKDGNKDAKDSDSIRLRVPYQDFVVRGDMGCGSTIGPMAAANLGLRTIDIGIPQWAMHSCKETCSTVDIQTFVDFSAAAFRNFRSIDGRMSQL